MHTDEALNTAMTARHAGRLDHAKAICIGLLERDPNHTHALLELASVELAKGNALAAAAAAQRIADQKSNDPNVLNAVALILAELENTEAAIAQMRKALLLRPQAAEIFNNLGSLLLRAGRINEAIDSYRKAAPLSPHTADIHANLGAALLQAGKSAEAITSLRIAATLDPNLHEAWAALGAALLNAGSPRAALGALRRAAELRPDHGASWHQLGIVLHTLGKFQEAAKCLERATRSEPNRIEYWLALARAQTACERFAEALAILERARPIEPDNGQILHQTAKALMELGCIEKATALLRRSGQVIADESRTTPLQSLAVIVPGNPDDDNRTILETRREYARRLEHRLPEPKAAYTGSRAIRIGYVSSFFHRANWMKPVWPLINNHHREQFQIHIFSDAPVEKCRYGYRIDRRDAFHDISGQSNQAAAETIRKQQLDILVDLNGYSEPDRLALFPLRLAPIQVAWFGMYATSGMDCFDYLIGDEHVIPQAEEAFYTERILRVPHSYLTFAVDYAVPEIAEVPFRKTGRMTLGCLAPQYKITDQMVRTWAAILHRTKAHLLLRNRAIGQNGNCRHLRERFAALNIPGERLQLEEPAEHVEFLSTYDRIDFALDTFPYSGATTTTEALWQGVPVVTFNGDRWVSRTSMSLLKAAGLDEFVADSRESYVELAVQLANSPDTPDRLAEFRANIRPRLQGSPVCDIRKFVGNMENLLRQMLGKDSAPHTNFTTIKHLL